MASKLRGIQIASDTLDNSHIAAAAAIATSKLADGAEFVKRDGSVAFNAVVSGVTPTLGSHLATKLYVDQLVTGLDPKESAKAATTANITLSGVQTIDGVSIVAGDRVLVKNQTTASQNGIYVAAVGSWVRATDANAGAELTTGAHFFVEQGSTQATTGWVLSTPGTITLDTTSLAFVQFSGAGTYSAGNGAVLSGSQFNVVSSNGGIVSGPGSIALTLADATLQITSTGLKLAALNSGRIFVGNASNVATSVAVSGDVALSNAGVATLAANVVGPSKMARNTAGQIWVGQSASTDVVARSITGAISLDANGLTALAANAVTAAAIADNAISLSKLAQMTAGNIIVGQGGSNSLSVAVSGDATMSQTGSLTIGANVVTPAKTARSASGTILVGQGAGADVSAKSVSGDVTMDANGVFTVGNTLFKIADCVVSETPAGAVNGANAVFTLASTPRLFQFLLFNGQVLEAGASNDFTISGTTITMLAPFIPTTADKIRAFYIK